MKYAKQVDAGWGGEALGKGKAAMTIEGNWIRGALKNDFPNIKTKVVELPAGPAGKGTLLFSNCWGIAAKTKNQAAAVDLVKSLTVRRPAAGLRQGVRRHAVDDRGRQAVRRRPSPTTPPSPPVATTAPAR